MARNVLACFAVVLVTMMMMEGLGSVAAFSCEKIATGLTPCIKYVHVGGRVVPTLCCVGFHALVAVATREGELQAACQCMKQLLETLPGVNWTYVNSVPVKCRVSPYHGRSLLLLTALTCTSKGGSCSVC